VSIDCRMLFLVPLFSRLRLRRLSLALASGTAVHDVSLVFRLSELAVSCLILSLFSWTTLYSRGSYLSYNGVTFLRLL